MRGVVHRARDALAGVAYDFREGGHRETAGEAQLVQTNPGLIVRAAHAFLWFTNVNFTTK